jgi:adenylosuccinate lyase
MQHALKAISPIDGRYASQTNVLSAYMSEQALMHYRVRVEILYFIELSKVNLFSLTQKQVKGLHAIYENFSEADAMVIKETEKDTNHDVKAVEYFIKSKFPALKLDKLQEFVHFGLTSQDINNTAIPMLWRDALHDVYLPKLIEILDAMVTQVQGWKDISMLARTHGQAASPTALGKEMMVFVERLGNQLTTLKQLDHHAKFGGATGNFNAHYVAYPKIDWVKFGNRFLEEVLELRRSQYTTQIEHYDMFAAQCDTLKRINTILIDYARDIWTYVSMDYFKQKTKPGEVGSSAMPHKVNPIDFENAEGNLGVANALLEHFSAKLPISRLQRDLTDSTVLRNIGVPLGHMLIALNSLQKGMGKLIVREDVIAAELNDNWAVVAEAVQTILRRERFDKPYEALKDLTRGTGAITKEVMHEFIAGLKVSDATKKELKKITPDNFVGNAKKSVKR